MTEYKETATDRLTQVLRAIATGAFALIAGSLLIATLLAAVGVLPWPTMTLAFGEVVVANAGMWVQIALTVFAVALLAYLPANRQMLALQKSHRDFHLSMNDVARAYAAVHAADREGAFTMSSEFDSVRERIDYMRNHPELRNLEPGVLEVAAQMSQTSRELADVYSVEKIERARHFLRQRQEEIEAFGEQLDLARHLTDEIKRWREQLNVESAVQATQLEQLETDLLELLPDLGFDVEEEYVDTDTTDDVANGTVEKMPATPAEHNVVHIPQPEQRRAPRFRDAGPRAEAAE